MEFKDYYKSLGVSKTASDKEIKKTYRKLARQHHPDLNPGDKSAEEKFKSINEAYEVLGDPEKRKKYDELGSNWDQVIKDREYARQYTRPDYQWSTTEDLNLGDFFEAFFGRRTGSPQSGFRTTRTAQPISGEDIESEIELSVEELIQGRKRTLRLGIPQVCTNCGGEGVIPVSTEGRKGQPIVTSMKTCPTCRGQGQTTEVRELEVKIPKGMKNGSRLRLSGQGSKGYRGGRNGDLYLRIRVKPHPVFRMEGYDLHADLPLLDHEVALGAKINLKTPNGLVYLTIPPETRSGQSLRLRGKGLSKSGGQGFGDLYFHVKVQIPVEIDAKEKELYLELEKLRANRNGIRKMFDS